MRLRLVLRVKTLRTYAAANVILIDSCAVSGPTELCELAGAGYSKHGRAAI